MARKRSNRRWLREYVISYAREHFESVGTDESLSKANFMPDETLEWLLGFSRRLLLAGVSEGKLYELISELTYLGVADPASCGCDVVRKGHPILSWSHQNHALYNLLLRVILEKSDKMELLRELVGVEARGSGERIDPDYAEALYQNFFAPVPNNSWFQL